MIRIGINTVYGMNDSTTFTEEDFKNALELNKELAKNSPEKNQKLMNELDRLEAEAILAQSLSSLHFGKPRHHLEVPVVPEPSKPEPEKKSFYNYGLYFRSENPPSVYKLSGDLSTFDQQDIDFNSNLPQRILNDYLENQRKKYIDELTNKDIQKRPFGECCVEAKKETKSKDELVGRIEEEFLEVPKPPPKWRKFADKDGDVYYYNLVTKVCQWNKPDEFEE